MRQRADDEVEPGHDVGSVAFLAIAFLVLVAVLSVAVMLGIF